VTTRVVNLNRQAYDVRIDRRGPYGNSFVIGRDGDRATVIEKHMAHWRTLLANPVTYQHAIACLSYMKGKRLGCHCKPKSCQGDNYVQLIAEFCP